MNNLNNGENQPSYLRVLTIIHLALLIGQVLFAVVVYSISKNITVVTSATNDPFFFIVPVFALAGIVGGSFLFKQKLNGLSADEQLKEKLIAYQTACIIRYAMAEAPSLLGIVAFQLSGNLVFLFFSGLIILYFIWIRPNKEKIVEQLFLSYDEKNNL